MTHDTEPTTDSRGRASLALALALSAAAAALLGCETEPPDYKRTGEYGIDPWTLPDDGSAPERRWIDDAVANQPASTGLFRRREEADPAAGGTGGGSAPQPAPAGP